MIYYIFKEQLFTVFLSMTHLTAIGVGAKIDDYVGGSKGDFNIYELNRKKSLVFESKKKGINKNFIIFTKKKKYHLNLKYDESLSDKDIEIKEAKKCSRYRLVKEEARYKIFSCPRSFYVKTKSMIRLNDTYLNGSKFISKGPPIWIDNKLVYKGERFL